MSKAVFKIIEVTHELNGVFQTAYAVESTMNGESHLVPFIDENDRPFGAVTVKAALIEMLEDSGFIVHDDDTLELIGEVEMVPPSYQH